MAQDYKRAVDENDIANQIGSRMHDLGKFIGDKRSDRANLEFTQGQENQRQSNQLGATRSNLEYSEGQQNTRQGAQLQNTRDLENVRVKAQQDLANLESMNREHEAKTGQKLDIEKQRLELQDKIKQIDDLQTKNPNAMVEGAGIKIDNFTPLEKSVGESKGLVGEFKDRTATDQEALRGVQLIKENLANPSALNPGLIQSEMAKLSVKGRIPQQEYNRIFPSSIKQDAAHAYNYMGPLLKYVGLPEKVPESNNSLSPVQMEFINKTLENVEKSSRSNIENARGELMQTGSQQAPVMNMRGSLPGFVKSLGSQYSGQPTQRPAAPMAPPPVQQPVAPAAGGFDPDAYLKGIK